MATTTISDKLRAQRRQRLVFALSLLTALYLWRWGSILAATTAALIAFVAAPDRFAARAYKAFMDWPDSLILDYRRPPDWFILGVSYPLRRLFPVKTRGLEHIPQGDKVLFIGNHQIWATDVPLKFPTIYERTGLYARAITDRAHASIPLFKHLIIYTGGIPGGKEHIDTLMKRGETLLIYPGGANEVWKNKDDPPYSLHWKERMGFARLAAEHGYKIVPFASVGISDALSIWFTIPAKLLWSLLGDGRARNRAPEMGDGIPVLWPSLKPQVNYLLFGKPIDASAFDAADADAVRRLRDEVKSAVEGEIKEALAWQANDPERYTDVVSILSGGLWSSAQAGTAKKVD